MPLKVEKTPFPPITLVHDVDSPNASPRRVSLAPQDAVLWCHAWDMGNPGQLELYRHLLIRTTQGWALGRYWAKDPT